MFQCVPAESMIRASSLVVTADDLGQSAARNRAILQSLQRGYATHTSLIVNLEGFDEAYELIRAERLEDVVGLHLNFTDGVPLTDGMKRSARFCVDGRFRFPLVGRGLLPLAAGDQELVRDEALAQLARARNAGFPITHIDSHHHVHMTPNMASVLLAVATALGVRRVRRFSNCGPHEGWFRRLKGAVFHRQLKRMGCESTEDFGDLEDIRWMMAHGKSIDGSLEIVTHPTLRPDGAIVDGKDPDKLSERILGLRPFFPSLINEAGRINRASAP